MKDERTPVAPSGANPAPRHSARKALSSAMAAALAIPLAASLAACSSTPPPPDWRLNAHGALERAVAAYLSGDSRVADAEFQRSRAEMARTARVDLVARGELVRCAAQAASLVDEACTGFEALHQDAPAAERAYADFLRHPTGAPAELALLPPQQQAIAAASATAASDLAALRAMSDPLSRLVGAAASLRAGRASPAVIDLAIATASDQGWRRPLLAWLGVARQRAEAAGERAEAERLARRIALVLGGPSTPQ